MRNTAVCIAASVDDGGSSLWPGIVIEACTAYILLVNPHLCQHYARAHRPQPAKPGGGVSAPKGCTKVTHTQRTIRANAPQPPQQLQRSPARTLASSGGSAQAATAPSAAVPAARAPAAALTAGKSNSTGSAVNHAQQVPQRVGGDFSRAKEEVMRAKQAKGASGATSSVHRGEGQLPVQQQKQEQPKLSLVQQQRLELQRQREAMSHRMHQLQQKG